MVTAQSMRAMPQNLWITGKGYFPGSLGRFLQTGRRCSVGWEGIPQMLTVITDPPGRDQTDQTRSDFSLIDGIAVGDWALGFWGALREVFPQTREQRCWFHKIASVLAALPKSAHPGVKKALAEIWNAEDKAHALAAVNTFAVAYGAKFGKAVAKVTDDIDELLAFYDFPAAHWIHLRTTNPIEPTIATVRHRTKVTKEPGSRAAGLPMAFNLSKSAQPRWRAVNAPHLVALARAGAAFDGGVLVARKESAA